TDRGSPPPPLLSYSEHEGQDEPGRGHLRCGRCPSPEPRHAPQVLDSCAEHKAEDHCEEEGHGGTIALRRSDLRSSQGPSSCRRSTLALPPQVREVSQPR